MGVTRFPNDVLTFHVAGKIQASNNARDMRLQRMLGHLTTLVPSTPRSVLVIGCGAGVTAGAVSIDPRVERETIAEIESRGGKAIGVALDLHDDDAIAALFARVKAEQGRLDILVNNAMAIPDSMTTGVPFWEKPLTDEWDIWDIGLRAAFIASHHAAKIMAPQVMTPSMATTGNAGTRNPRSISGRRTRMIQTPMQTKMNANNVPILVISPTMSSGMNAAKIEVKTKKSRLDL